MSRFSSIHYQTFLSSCSDFCALMFGLCCVHAQTFMCSSSDFVTLMSYFGVFKFRLCSAHVQKFMGPLDLHAFMLILPCVHVWTSVRSFLDSSLSYSDFRAFARFSCAHQTFVRCAHFFWVDVQVFLRSLDLRAVQIQIFFCSCSDLIFDNWNFEISAKKIIARFMPTV